MLRFPFSIFLPYTGDGRQITLSRKKAVAEWALIQEKLLICYQHVLFRWPPIRADQKVKKVSGERSIEMVS